MKRSLLAFLTTLICACSADLPKTSSEEFKRTITGEAQGTTWRIVYYDLKERDFKAEVDSILHTIDASISTYQTGSVIDRWNKSDSGGYIDPLFMELLLLSREMYALTLGAFDPTVMPLVAYWGFGPEKFEHPVQANTQVIDSLLYLVDFDTLQLRLGSESVALEDYDQKRYAGEDVFLIKPVPGMQLDFNAIGQGWSVDKVASFLESKGLKIFFVEIGGEILAGYPKPDGQRWKFGIDKPVDGNTERSLQAIINLRNRGLATSGNYRKFYESGGLRYSHTIDPTTGFPVKHRLLSATVVAQSAAKADALATAFMVMGTDSTIRFLDERPYIGAYVYLISDMGQGEYALYTSKQLEGMIEKATDAK